MADNLPGGSYGWIETRGHGEVNVSGQTQPAYVDFEPNLAKIRLNEEPRPESQEPCPILPPNIQKAAEADPVRYGRLCQLPPLLIEAGPYCDLIREARAVFVDGHDYACVAMCGISFERFQRDKAKQYGAKSEHTIKRVRDILIKNKVLKPATLKLCKMMAHLRNIYAHGHGLKPQEDALTALGWMHSFLDNETNLMRDFVIVNGVLTRKHTART
jgi:hypothetical protein